MKKISFLLLAFVANFLLSQTKIDGVAAVLNEEIILKSDVQEFLKINKTEYNLKDECSALDQLLQQKLLIAEAKKDTLIIVNEGKLAPQANETVKRAIEQFGDETKLLNLYGFASINEFRQEVLQGLVEQEYTQEIYRKLTKDIDASPIEVNDFYKQYQDELPKVDEEVEFSQIIIKPELSALHRQEMIEKLIEIRKKILSGETTFAEMAKEHSQDPGSAVDGGLMAGVRRGMMVKDFEGVMYNLLQDEISEPFETEYGYHIVQLVKRKGDILDVRHILLSNKPTEEEMAKAMEKAKEIKSRLDKAEITFNDAVKEYSTDKKDKLNNGKFIDPRTGNYKITKSGLPNSLILELITLGEGSFSNPFEYKGERDVKDVRIVRLDKNYPSHKMTITSDYDRIKQFVVNKKKNEKVEQWVPNHIKGNLIKIADDYKTCPFSNNWMNK